MTTPDEFSPDDPRRAWTNESVAAILEMHADAASVQTIADELDLPVREVVAVVGRMCDDPEHSHMWIGVVRVTSDEHPDPPAPVVTWPVAPLRRRPA